jgi:hypothetical protein
VTGKTVVPEEAVEAAVNAWDHHWGDRYGDEALEEMGDEVRVALEAAAPFIAAKAWDEGYMADGSAREGNPYRRPE